MKHTKFRLIQFFIICFIHIIYANPQKFQTKIIFPNDVDFSKLSIYYDNGLVQKRIEPIIQNNIWLFNDSCYDRYGVLSFYYQDGANKAFVKGYSFWIPNNSSKITFRNNSSNKNNPFENFELENVISLNDLNEEKLDEIEKKMYHDANLYLQNNFDSFKDGPDKKYQDMIDSLVNYGLRNIKLHSDDYYFLCYFQDAIVSTRNSFSTQELLNFYTSVFPDSLRNTTRGNRIESILKSRINSLKGNEAPLFQVEDINKNNISLSDYKNKFLLIEFWASWCAPCIKLAPAIKEIRNRYSEDILSIISVSIDDNYEDFANALTKIDINQTHIFNSKSIVNDYAVGAIPQIILIDKNGIVLYNKEEEKDPDLKILNQILDENLQSTELSLP